MMKLHLALACLTGAAAFAPQHVSRNNRFATDLSVSQRDNNSGRLVGGAIAFLSGIMAAGQVAFADPSILESYRMDSVSMNEYMIEKQVFSSSSNLISVGAPSFGGGASFETMDFSMPSYDGSASSTKNVAPSFTTVFQDNNESAGESNVDKEAEKAKAKEEDRIAKEKEAQSKEEARIAKEKESQAKAEAQAKKDAEIKARREAEKKKQEEFAARQKAAEEKEKADKAAAEAAKQVEVAPAPVISEKEEAAVAPAVLKKKEPAPEKKSSEAAPLKIESPKIDIPSFSAPKFDMPSVSTPKFEVPSVPSLSAPNFEAPTVPSFSAPKFDAPSFDAPKGYNFDVPKVSAPTVSTKPDVKPMEPLESQEVRDENAKAANLKFKDLDSKARDLEKKAAEAREVAKEAKKAARAAKDLACETRIGGKFLCIRSFNSGF